MLAQRGGAGLDPERGKQLMASRDLYNAERDLTVNHHYHGDVTGERALASASGRPVVVGDVPQEPPGFQVRADVLTVLGAHEGPGAVHVLTGIRGAGKTQLAGAVAREKLAAGWRLVAWVNAEDAGSLAAGLAEVARVAGLPVTGDAGPAVRHWLEADGERCLLVLDNVADADGLRPFVPAGGAAHVVITSTSLAVSVLGTPVPVGVFGMGEALAFLAARTGLKDEDGARELAEELGCLPLGLAQAAALIAVQRLTYQAYLERVRSLPVSAYLNRVKGEAYPYRLAEAIGLSLDSVTETDPPGGSAVVMGIVSLLAESGLSRRVLHAAASTSAQGISAAVMDDALGHLAEASLVGFSVDGELVSAHRLVMRAVRERLTADRPFPPEVRAAVFVLQRFANQIGEAWQDSAGVRELAAHCVALSRHLARHPGAVSDETSAELFSLRVQALYLRVNLGDNPAQAVTIGEQLAADCSKAYGIEHSRTLTASNNLGLAYLEAGRLPEAITLLQRSFVDSVRALGPDTVCTISLANNLGRAYQAARRPHDAILLLERAAATSAKVNGADHPDTIGCLNNLAMAYSDAGRKAKSLAVMQRAVEALERTQGPDHPETLTAKSNLALRMEAQGQTLDAIVDLEEILARRERIQGAEHPLTLTACNNLAYVYSSAGMADKAVPLYERALIGLERVQGPNHPSTRDVRTNLAAARARISSN
jgi:tetratricopeptide (TPR) repeat protein